MRPGQNLEAQSSQTTLEGAGQKISRRDFMKLLTILGLSVLSMDFLAACGAIPETPTVPTLPAGTGDENVNDVATEAPAAPAEKIYPKAILETLTDAEVQEWRDSFATKNIRYFDQTANSGYGDWVSEVGSKSKFGGIWSGLKLVDETGAKLMKAGYMLNGQEMTAMIEVDGEGIVVPKDYNFGTDENPSDVVGIGWGADATPLQYHVGGENKGKMFFIDMQNGKKEYQLASTPTGSGKWLDIIPKTGEVTASVPSVIQSLNLDPATWQYQLDQDGQLSIAVGGEMKAVYEKGEGWLVQLPLEVVQAVETQLEGYKVKGNRLKDKLGNYLPGITIYRASNGMIIFQQPAQLNGKEYIQNYPLVSADKKIQRVTVTEDGKLDMPGQKWNPDTQMYEPETVLYPVPKTDGKVEQTDIPLVSMSTAMEMLRQATQTVKDANKGVLPESARIGKYSDIYRSNGQAMIYTYKNEELLFRGKFKGTGHQYFDGNTMSVWDEAIGEYITVPTVYYGATTFGIEPKTQYGFITFKDLNGDVQQIFIDRADMNDRTKGGNTWFGDVY